MDTMETAGSGGQPLDRDGESLRNSALEEAMLEVSRFDSPQARALLYQLLLDALIVVAVPEAIGEGVRTIDAGESLALMTLRDEEGTILPVFTNAEAFTAWRPEGGAVLTLPARAVFQMAAAEATQKIVINPASPTWGVVTSREILALARGRLPLSDGSEVVAEAAQIKVGVPDRPPPAEVLAAVDASLAEEPSARAAWLFLIKQGETPAEMAVAIEFDETPDDPRHRNAMRKIVDGTGARCEAARSLVFLTADESWHETLAAGSGIEIFRRRTPESP